MPSHIWTQRYELDFSLLLKVFYIFFEYYEQMVFRSSDNKRNIFKLQSSSSE